LPRAVPVSSTASRRSPTKTTGSFRSGSLTASDTVSVTPARATRGSMTGVPTSSGGLSITSLGMQRPAILLHR
jgi:hypothetical protein